MTKPDVAAPALAFLRCRTPPAWLDVAVGRIDLLLQDHATLELRAAEQAQKLIRKYGAAGGHRRQGRGRDDDWASTAAPFRRALLQRLSRLAREELRHFEQVTGILNARGCEYRPVSASRYAAGLHALVRAGEPAALVDTLLVGAIIEARSCERFASLVPVLESAEPALAHFYASLLRSEARHFQDYLRLARAIRAADDDADSVGGDDSVEARLDVLLDRDRALITDADGEFRFHSGPPASR